MSAQVLHVTESMGGGVYTLLDSISRGQVAEGAEVEVLFLERPDTPSDAAMQERFDPRVKLRRLVTGSRPRDFLALGRTVREELQSGRFDAVHLHSSFAGAIGRTSALGVHTKTRLFYSPHGFAFLRLNTSATNRRVVKQVERMLVKRADLILTSGTEYNLAVDELGATGAALLRTGVPSSTIVARPRAAARERPRVGMVGRVTYQKAPWRFAAVARALADDAEFVWIGGGAPEDEERWIGDAPVEITGWVSAAELVDLMDSLDVLLFPSLWEGMSLALIQAQAQGLPAVVSDVVGNRDAVKNAVTGFVCATDEELVERTRELILDPVLRTRFSQAALEWSRDNLTDDQIGEDSLNIYAQASRSRGGAR